MGFDFIYKGFGFIYMGFDIIYTGFGFIYMGFDIIYKGFDSPFSLMPSDERRARLSMRVTRV